MKTEFDKWYRRRGFDNRNQRILSKKDLKVSWNAAINKAWHIVKHYDDDTMLKETLMNLKK